MLEPFGDRAVISASRRTDVPAFHARWLLDGLEKGHVLVPGLHGQPPRAVSLARRDVWGLVLWTRNPGPLLGSWDRLLALCPNLFFHLTITGLPRFLEPRTPEPGDAVALAAELAARLSPEHLVWRFDPLCPVPGWGLAEHEGAFRTLARALEGRVRTCLTSYVAPYAKTLRHLALAGQVPVPLSAEEKAAFAGRLAAIGREHGIALAACCDPEALAGGLAPGRCVDGKLLARLWEAPLLAALPAAPSRPGCGCGRSIDIGTYDTCAHGCLYCYATAGPRVRREKN